MLKLYKGKSVELSNQRRKLALSKNFDSWFIYCVRSQQNPVSVKFVLWPFWLSKLSAWESKIAFNLCPPPPPSLSLTCHTVWYSKNWYVNHVFGLRNFAAQCSSLHSKQDENEQVSSKNRLFLTVYTVWLDSLMTSKMQVLDMIKTKHKPVSMQILSSSECVINWNNW